MFYSAETNSIAGSAWKSVSLFDSIGGTKSLITPKDGFDVASSSILLVLIEKHVIIELYSLVDVTGLLAPEKIKSCFQEISQEFS